GGVSRREAIGMALAQAAGDAAGAVLASDGPITAAEDLDLLMRRGIVAVAHPGSPADASIISAGSNVLAFVATGIAHLRD
ncbi:MAG: bifunctional phosphoribosylaminoimidazolecarboxamide formyltransferase/IMP cyclohydrolase, partial [Polyangiales bacterium]